MDILEVKDISFNYPDKTIIKNLSFNVEKGDFVCIVGTNGTGKSTLAFKIIEEVAKNHKVICIDITGEYKIKFKEQSTIISNANNLNDNGIYIYEII